MALRSRVDLLSFVPAWLLIGSSAWAQMPMVGGKGGRADAIDQGIIREKLVEKFVPQLPAPRQVQAFDINLSRPRNYTLEEATPETPDDLIGPPEDRPSQQAAMPLNLNNPVLKRENFDRWVFSEGVFEVGRREHLDSLVRERIEFVTRTRALTASEESKLRIACQGDIKRFLDRVEVCRREFETARRDLNTGIFFLNSLEPLRKEFEVGPFGEGSLFAKTLRKIKNDAQAARTSGNR